MKTKFVISNLTLLTFLTEDVNRGGQMTPYKDIIPNGILRLVDSSLQSFDKSLSSSSQALDKQNVADEEKMQFLNLFFLTL